MKKMMIIAVMMGAMLIPAQMEASNKVNNKAKVEYKKNEEKKFDKKKEFNNKKELNKKNELNKKKNFDKKQKKDYNNKNKKKYDKKQNKPMVKMEPPRSYQIKVENKANPVNAVASAIGLVALAAIIAN